MKKFRIALFHCPESSEYKLIKLTPEMDENDPCVMWVFDSSKLALAKKIMRNMNVAAVTSSETLLMNVA